MKQFHFLVYGKDERQRCLKEILENRGHVAKNAEESSAGFFDAILLPLPETETFFGKIKEELVPGQIVFGANFGQSVACQAKEKKNHGRGLHESGRGGGKKRGVRRGRDPCGGDLRHEGKSLWKPLSGVWVREMRKPDRRAAGGMSGGRGCI